MSKVPIPMAKAIISTDPNAIDFWLAMNERITVSAGVVQGEAINPLVEPKRNAPNNVVDVFC